jgi:hypothetical protein
MGITHCPRMVTPTADNRKGRVRDVVCQGVLLPIPSKIKAVVVSSMASIEANPIPEKFKLWLGDNLASTRKISFTPHLKKT